MPKKYTTEQFVEKAKKIHGNKYDYSETVYVNYKQKLKIICPIHGVFEMTPDDHLHNHGCKECGKISIGLKERASKEQFIEKAKKVHGNKYDYSITKFETYRSGKIDIICPIHGVFSQDPRAHIRGNGCPYCRESHGEKSIRLWLDDNGIEFKRNYKFKDLGNLSYDFFIPSKNLLIEYDGEQHFKENSFGHHNLEIQKQRDQLKEEYAKEHNINLLRIPYTQFKEIKDILNKLTI